MARLYENISKVVTVGRKKSNLSQGDLAYLLGYENGQFISNVERGLCSIPQKKIAKLSMAILVPAKEIIDAMVKDYGVTLERIVKDES